MRASGERMGGAGHAGLHPPCTPWPQDPQPRSPARADAHAGAALFAMLEQLAAAALAAAAVVVVIEPAGLAALGALVLLVAAGGRAPGVGRGRALAPPTYHIWQETFHLHARLTSACTGDRSRCRASAPAAGVCCGNACVGGQSGQLSIPQGQNETGCSPMEQPTALPAGRGIQQVPAHQVPSMVERKPGRQRSQRSEGVLVAGSNTHSMQFVTRQPSCMQAPLLSAVQPGMQSSQNSGSGQEPGAAEQWGSTHGT